MKIVLLLCWFALETWKCFTTFSKIYWTMKALLPNQKQATHLKIQKENNYYDNN